MSAKSCVAVETEEIVSDDEDYFSCLSELAPFASNECLYGGGFGLEDRSYGRDEVDACFDKSCDPSDGITIIPLQNQCSGEDDDVLDDIRYLFGDSSDEGSMSSLDQVQSSTEIQYERDTVIDWSKFFGLQEVAPRSVSSSRRTSSESVNIWIENYLRSLDDHSDSDDETTEGFNQIFPEAESYPRHEGVKEWENGTPGDLRNGVEEGVLQTEKRSASESQENPTSLKLDENSNSDSVVGAELENWDQKSAISPPTDMAPKSRERLECATVPPLRTPRLACVMLRTESEMIFPKFDESLLPPDLKIGLSEDSGLKRMRAENAIYGYEPSIDDLRKYVDKPDAEVLQNTEKISEVKRKSRFRRFLSSIRGVFPCLKKKSKKNKRDKVDRD